MEPIASLSMAVMTLKTCLSNLTNERLPMNRLKVLGWLAFWIAVLWATNEYVIKELMR